MKRMCVVRFDDLCQTMDLSSFFKAFQLCDFYQSKPLLGVIPDNNDNDLFCDQSMNDKEFWELIRQLQNKGYCIAMHGFTHVYDQEFPNTILCGKKHSEFAGNSFENQYEKIRKGKKILNDNGIYTDIFFAPAHTYDKNTLKALYKNGFKYLCDGYSHKPYNQCGIVCVPLSSLGRNGIHFSVNHPNEWSKADKANDYSYLERFFQNNTNCLCSFDDLKHVKCGVFFLQKIIEILRLKLRPILLATKKMMKIKG